jgi:hypothetical protein
VEEEGCDGDGRRRLSRARIETQVTWASGGVLQEEVGEGRTVGQLGGVVCVGHFYKFTQPAGSDAFFTILSIC